jgi:acyl-CoA thioesterase YciA
VTETGLPAGRVPIIRLPATPADANKDGSIFGGWIMSQVDIAGSIPAEIVAKGPIVTRAVDSFEFKKPVFVGDLISCYADMIAIGRTSVTVKVDVYAQRRRGDQLETIVVTEASLVYVAIDQHGKPRAISKD